MQKLMSSAFDNNSYYLLRFYYVPAISIYILYYLFQLMLTATLVNRYYHPHFTDEKTEAKGAKIACPWLNS